MAELTTAGNWTRAVVTGRTWRVKETFKRHGGRWDPAVKAWTFEVFDEVERCQIAAMLSDIPGIKVDVSSPAAATAERWEDPHNNDGWEQGYAEITEPWRGSQGGDR